MMMMMKASIINLKGIQSPDQIHIDPSDYANPVHKLPM